MKNGLIIDHDGVERYYKNDLLHREDGPAVDWRDSIYPMAILNERCYWFYDGEYIHCRTQEQFQEIVKNKLSKK